MNDLFLNLYHKIQNILPVTRSEINIAFIILIAVSLNLSFALLNGNNLSEEDKQAILKASDSLDNNSKSINTKPSDFKHIPRDSISGIILKVDPNLASKNELMTLRGVGPSTANKIITARKNGIIFTKAEDLILISGIGPKTLKKFSDQLIFKKSTSLNTNSHTLTSTKINKKININTADQQTLMKVPGIGKSISQRIIEYRNNQPFQSIEDIKKVPGIGNKKFENLKEFIEISLSKSNKLDL